MNSWNKIALCLLLCAGVACKTSQPKKSLATFPLEKMVDTSSVLKNGHVGILVKDLTTDQTIFKLNANKNFIPASNTKLLTMYAALSKVPAKVPALYYIENDTSVVFWGTGDPTFLHRKLKGNAAYEFLKKQTKTLYFSAVNFQEPNLGKGWAWDDYNDSYQVERTSLPIYGNTAYFYRKNSNWFVDPSVLSNNPFLFSPYGDIINRDLKFNAFYIPLQSGQDSQEIPLAFSPQLTAELLADTLQKKVGLSTLVLPDDYRMISGLELEPIIKEMMERSDNFLAEQLLLMASTSLGDTLSSQTIIENLLSSDFQSFFNTPRWVDGSGLSRYNLITPETLVSLLELMHSKFGSERILPLLAKNGQYGTLRNFSPEKETYLYAKSGSMSGVYNLSGYLISKSGKTLVFSIMHNNFIGSIAERRDWTAKFCDYLQQAF